MAKRWQSGEARDLSRLNLDARLYREYTLALIWPRSCPEFIDDDTVSRELRKCAANNRLPWKCYE
jgi:hypothetical protein